VSIDKAGGQYLEFKAVLKSVEPPDCTDFTLRDAPDEDQQHSLDRLVLLGTQVQFVVLTSEEVQNPTAHFQVDTVKQVEWFVLDAVLLDSFAHQFLDRHFFEPVVSKKLATQITFVER